MVLVQWTGVPPEESTWEKWDILQATYHLEDKVNFLREGIVSKRPTYLKDFVSH